MKTININSINFELLTKLNQQGGFSKIYRDENTCYKIFNRLFFQERQEIYEKFSLMKDIEIDHVILPQEFIIENTNIKGYTMKYIPNTTSMATKYTHNTKNLNTNEFFNSIIKSSKILREIHQQDIIYQDLSFENILIDSNNECYFIDLDGCSYKGIEGRFISYLANHFFTRYRKENVKINKNLDRISMLLSFFNTIFQSPIENISKQEYEELKKYINTLNNLSNYVDMLLDKSNPIEYIPYLDEVIDVSDDYILKKIRD